MHYFKRNIGDYHKKAGRLTMLQHGAYTLLMDACYDRERFPTLADAIDWCWAASDDEIAAVQFVLGKFFDLVDGQYQQTRIQEEIDDFHGKSETNRRIALEREEKRRNGARNVSKKARTVHAPSPEDHEPPPNQEPLTINQEPLTKEDTAVAFAPVSVDDVRTVFEFWQTTMESQRSKLDNNRDGLIRKSLKTGYTVEQLCDAIRGCAKSDYHMGKNENGTKYNGLDLILRNAEKIDKFIVIGQSTLIPHRKAGYTHSLADQKYQASDDHSF